MKKAPRPSKTQALLQAVAPAAPKTRRAARLKVFVDFPAQEEGISARQYSFRFGAIPSADRVEVSIDRGPWLACRPSVGYWWYDWSGFGPGVHRVTARAAAGTSTPVVSKQRRFQVV